MNAIFVPKYLGSIALKENISKQGTNNQSHVNHIGSGIFELNLLITAARRFPTALFIVSLKLLSLSQPSNIDHPVYLKGPSANVPYTTPRLAENTGNVKLGAAPLVQHYSVFSARPGLGYGTLIQCSHLGLVWGMGH